MWGRTQRAEEPRPGRLVFALRSAVWPLEGAALPPTRGGRRGKEAAGALLGAEPPGPPGRCRHDAEPGRTPSGTGSGTSAVRFFRSLQSGPWAKSPRTTDLGLGPVARAAAGSGRFSKGFHFKAAHAGACRGPGDLRLVAETEPPGATSPGRYPGGGGGAPSPRPLRDLGHFQGWRGVTQPGSPWLCCPGTAVGPVVWPPGASARFCHRGVSVGQAPRTRAPVCGHLSLGPRPGLGLSPKRPRSRHLSVCLTL